MGRVLLTFMAAQCVACGLPPVVEIPPPPDLPHEWGSYATTRVSGSDCPSVSGIYRLTAELRIAVRGPRERPIRPDLAYYSIFPLHIADKRESGAKVASGKIGLLMVEQPEGNTLTIREATTEGEVVRTYTLFQREGDFECVHGFVRFPSTSHFGSLEGVTLNGQSVVQIRLNEDGDLVGQKSWGPYRSRKKNAQSKFAHEFYRFQRIDD